MPPLIVQVPDSLRAEFIESARDTERIREYTHPFYRYPARFSPKFAAAAIRCFSRPGDLVLDPFMGGGTTIIEALLAGRRAIGNDLNSVAVFLAKVKTQRLSEAEREELHRWVRQVAGKMSYLYPRHRIQDCLADERTTNLNLPRARFIKKAIAVALKSIECLQYPHLQEFARCVMLKTGQWALDGRRRHTSLSDFRSRLVFVASQMLEASRLLSDRLTDISNTSTLWCKLVQGDASHIHLNECFSVSGEKAALVVTSPPYPGVHVLYNRWQVDGRRESPAPYWIANCHDGDAPSCYTFGCRKEKGLRSYFARCLSTFRSVRRVMRDGAFLVQLVAFSDPRRDLKRFLKVLQAAGFTELSLLPLTNKGTMRRLWRRIPNRRWHAAMNGRTQSSREVVLIHSAT